MNDDHKSGGVVIPLIPRFATLGIIWTRQGGNTAIMVTMRVWNAGMGISFTTYEG